MIEPIVKTIQVPCNKQEAFVIFLEEMHTWWPLGKFTTSAMGGNPAKSIQIEAKVGGKITEIGPEDEQIEWGSIKSYDPHDAVSMYFHIPVPGEVVKSRSLVEVHFTALAKERTQVVLTQSNWEAFGKRAKGLRGGYGGGWTMIFEGAYKAACEG